MSTAIPRARKLSSFVKCGRCRQDRQKCERPDISQKCLRCAKYKHDCDSGRASNRAQRSQKLSARQRAAPSERATAAPSTTQYDLLVADPYPRSFQETFSLKAEESSSSRMSRSASSERSTSRSTPSTHEGLQLQFFPGQYPHETRHDSAYSLQWTSDPEAFGDSSASSEHDTTYGWESMGWDEPKVAQSVFEHPNNLRGIDLVPAASDLVDPTVACPVIPITNMQTLSGLTNIRPSRHCTSTPFEERLNNRINRLWGNYKTFAAASSKGLGVTPLFGRTLSELFRQSRQMAENGDNLVADVRYACGAADACMNTKLPLQTRAQYQEAYQRYDARANTKYRRAVQDFAEKITADESPDVLPLYTATFLYYAAGACMRGSTDLLKAIFAFKYFDQYTAWFPIRIEILPIHDGQWAADMLLKNDKQDPGMRINTLMFALGRARLEFDRKDGLC